ncbi:hypothetical protein RN001_013312 [Aquatica leii]|uniref:NF-kappa-B-activating protein C-terminal domain-containing protein n=1 Tax=Aquatica leii TaxID=1421715 RepID=A0AAN7PRL5_9COLE|nr:hypothetical protein RN001_013312 [Aquatica leii]
MQKKTQKIEERKSKEIEKKKRFFSESSSDEWVEKDEKRIINKTHSDTEELYCVFGPHQKAHATLTHREMAKALWPGEGTAMAAYVAEEKRIPRRGDKLFMQVEVSQCGREKFLLQKKMSMKRIWHQWNSGDFDDCYNSDFKDDDPLFSPNEDDVSKSSDFKEGVVTKKIRKGSLAATIDN